MSRVINLGEVRTARDAAVDAVRVYVKGLAKFLVDESVTYADRAFAVADPARDTDPDLARDVYRAAHRRLRASLRRRLGQPVNPDMKRQVLEQAESVFQARVWQLQGERHVKLASGGSS